MLIVQGVVNGNDAGLEFKLDDLAISGDEPLPLWQLVAALKPPGREGAVPPNLTTRLFTAALRGQPFPREIAP